MEFSYKKNDNTDLFRSLEREELTNISKLQNYIPIYNTFFKLSNTNYNAINLNNNFIKSIETKDTENKYTGTISDVSGQTTTKYFFFKYSPLLDPVKYVTGKYDDISKVLTLPTNNDKIGYAKTRDPNNSAYVDGFFSYITSQMLANYKFIHGLDYYGSFLGIKKKFTYDISEEIEYLYDSEFFHKNNNILFSLNNNIHSELLNKDTRNYKDKITIGNNISPSVLNSNDSSFELHELNQLFSINSENDVYDSSNVELCYEGYINTQNGKNETANSCSSNSSYSSSEESDIEEDISCIESDESSEDSSLMSDDVINININDFPIELIALERCNNTLDSLFTENNLCDEELSCIIIQILMILITYQKVFKFTHNDLHSNNIMYVETPKEFLYYKYNNKYYKIQTFGKIFKLIDFGRSIYTFRNNLICSDSYHSKGDAASQYNFGPYYNKNKPLLEPNYSFDLCRLGCSLYDYFVDSFETRNNIQSKIINIILTWCNDDKDKNILYKNNGSERYPEFKLYKMIARTVHNHVPSKVIENNYFDKYIISSKQIKRIKNKVINIDNLLPEY